MIPCTSPLVNLGNADKIQHLLNRNSNVNVMNFDEILQNKKLTKVFKLVQLCLGVHLR